MLAVVMAVGRAAPALFGRANVALGWAPRPGARVIAAIPVVTIPVEVPAAPVSPTHAPSATPALVARSPGGTSRNGTETASVPGASGLLIPVRGVKASSLVDTYQQARGQGRRHDAIDILAPRGTPVVAVADGVVLKLFRSERGGITLYHLAPDRRTVYYYAHLDRYAAGMVEGRGLRRGDVLGYVGDTGDAAPGNHHLHFEVTTTSDPKKYWGGVPQNPYPLLQ
jgi:murein DD-endopeptidase MepM/ murein hydrolase activator NlpD